MDDFCEAMMGLKSEIESLKNERKQDKVTMMELKSEVKLLRDEREKDKTTIENLQERNRGLQN